MIEVILPADNGNINSRAGKFVVMHSPSLEVHKWFMDKDVSCIYQPLWVTPPGDLRRSQRFYGLRFKFLDERMAVMFKLTFGGA